MSDAFGDFDEDDVIDEVDISPEDWSKVETLQEEYNKVLKIDDPADRITAAKLLVQNMNGSV